MSRFQGSGGLLHRQQAANIAGVRVRARERIDIAWQTLPQLRFEVGSLDLARQAERERERRENERQNERERERERENKKRK